MADYPLVSINNYFLTDDGTNTGLPCRVNIPTLDQLQFDFTGQTVQAADGTVHQHILDFAKVGALVDVNCFQLLQDVYEDIRDSMATAVSGDTTSNLTISSPYGDFDLEVKPVLPKPIESPGTFVDDRLDNVTFHFIIDSVN